MCSHFANRINWLAYFIYVAIVVLTVFATARFAVTQGDLFFGKMFTIFGYAMIFLALFSVGVHLTVGYEITATELRIHPNWLPGVGKRIFLEAIQSVIPLNSTFGISAHTFALSPLRLNYIKPNGKQTFLIISPRNQDDFLRELERRCPHLVLSGDRLVPPSVPKYIT